MSKLLKNMVTSELSKRLDGVEEAILVNLIGLKANDTVQLRKDLREKDIQILVVKNSLARRATEGTALSPAFEGVEGTLAIMWGSEDIVSLAKEATRLSSDKKIAAFETKGGVMEGESLTPEKVKEISDWPTREEQLSLLVGQLLGPGRTLAAALIGPGATLASQVKKKSEEEE